MEFQLFLAGIVVRETRDAPPEFCMWDSHSDSFVTKMKIWDYKSTARWGGIVDAGGHTDLTLALPCPASGALALHGKWSVHVFAKSLPTVNLSLENEICKMDQKDQMPAMIYI